MSLSTIDLPEIFHPKDFGQRGYLTVDVGSATIKEIPFEERKTVAEVFPDQKDTSIAGYYVAATIHQPEDVLIVPPAYSTCIIRKKTDDITHEEALMKALDGSELVASFLAEEKKP